MRISWPQALGWRMGRQLLDPIGTRSAVEVVRRLGGVQAQVASTADLKVRVRGGGSRAGDVSRALAKGHLIKTWAMRGALHLLTPEEGGAYLSMLAMGRGWERPAWVRYFGMEVKHWARMRSVVREALAGPPLTREELIAAIVEEPAQPPGPGAPLGLGHPLQAPRIPGRPLLRPQPGESRDLHATRRGERPLGRRP